jgi:hypothetical protein
MVVRGPALVGVGGPAVGSGTPAGPGAPAGGSGAPTGSPPSVVDADGDGYTTAIDCNDADRAVHPGAADVPDFAFADSNCDGIDGDEPRAVFVSPSGTTPLPARARCPSGRSRPPSPARRRQAKTSTRRREPTPRPCPRPTAWASTAATVPAGPAP